MPLADEIRDALARELGKVGKTGSGGGGENRRRALQALLEPGADSQVALVLAILHVADVIEEGLR